MSKENQNKRTGNSPRPAERTNRDGAQGRYQEGGINRKSDTTVSGRPPKRNNPKKD